MPDFTEPWQQERKIDKLPVKQNPGQTEKSKPNVSDAEFLAVFVIAAIADLAGPFGFPCGAFLCFWYWYRFHKFPTWKIIVAIVGEGVTGGILPGWTGFVVATYLEYKGYLKSKILKKALAIK